MRVLTRGTAIAFAIVVSSGTNAADLSYPPPVIGQPQYGMVAPPAAASPQVIIVPGAAASPQYPGRASSAPAGWGLPVWYSTANPSKGRCYATSKLPTSLALQRRRLSLAARLRTAARTLL